jgi:uncharacterized protein (DUF1697 family)
MTTSSVRYVLFLRGINVGGNKKVPMATLKKMLEQMGFENVKTLLNSGNVAFDGPKTAPDTLVAAIEKEFAKTFGFTSDCIIRTRDELVALRKADPFKGIKVDADTRLYVTFLGDRKKQHSLKLPWKSPDADYRILKAADGEVISMLRVNKNTRSVDAMAVLEEEFGKNVTTRNWNTVEKLLA